MNITIAKNGQQIGPFDEAQVAGMLKSGMLATTDLGWAEGMDEWKPLSSFGKFQSFATELPPKPDYPAQGEIDPKCKSAVTILLLGILSIILFPLGILAVLYGHKRQAQIKRTQIKEGTWMTFVGVALGYVGSALTLWMLIAWSAVFLSNRLKSLDRTSPLGTPTPITSPIK